MKSIKVLPKINKINKIHQNLSQPQLFIISLTTPPIPLSSPPEPNSSSISIKVRTPNPPLSFSLHFFPNPLLLFPFYTISGALGSEPLQLSAFCFTPALKHSPPLCIFDGSCLKDLIFICILSFNIYKLRETTKKWEASGGKRSLLSG